MTFYASIEARHETYFSFMNLCLPSYIRGVCTRTFKNDFLIVLQHQQGTVGERLLCGRQNRIVVKGYFVAAKLFTNSREGYCTSVYHNPSLCVHQPFQAISSKTYWATPAFVPAPRKQEKIYDKTNQKPAANGEA